MEIVVNTARISLVDFDHRQEILVCHQHFILVVEQASEEDTAPQVLLELARRREQLLYRCFLLVITPLHGRRLLGVLWPSYVREQSIQLFQSASKPWHSAIYVPPTWNDTRALYLLRDRYVTRDGGSKLDSIQTRSKSTNRSRSTFLCCSIYYATRKLKIILLLGVTWAGVEFLNLL